MPFTRLAYLDHGLESLQIRAIHHHLEGRVSAHIFQCMLAYYVERHMREAWRELMFAEEDLEHKKTPTIPSPPLAAFAKLPKDLRPNVLDNSQSLSILRGCLAATRGESRTTEKAMTSGSMKMMCRYLLK